MNPLLWAVAGVVVVLVIAVVVRHRRRGRHCARRGVQQLRPAVASEEARDALWQAQRGLLDAHRLEAAAQDVEKRLRDTQERNHFAEAVERSIRRRAS